MNERQQPPSRPGTMEQQVVDFIDQRLPFPIGSLLLAVICGLYLTNPTLGFIELIPDTLPLGNLDEGAAGILLAWTISNLGRWWRYRRARRRARHEEKEGS